MSASSTASTSSMAMKRILVTGGNKGIGRAICERLLSQYPDTYVLLGSRNLERGQQAVQAIINDIPSSQGRVQCVTIDTASDESVKTAAAIIADQFAPLYGIVNNAGVRTSYREPAIHPKHKEVIFFEPWRDGDFLTSSSSFVVFASFLFCFVFTLFTGGMGTFGVRHHQHQLLWTPTGQ